MISMLCLSLFQNDYISKQLDIFYIKPFFFIFLQPLIAFEYKVNFNQFL